MNTECGNSARYKLSRDEYLTLDALAEQVFGISLGMVRVIPCSGEKTDSLTVALLNRPYPHLDVLRSWLGQVCREDQIPYQQEKILLKPYKSARHRILMGYGEKSNAVAYRFEAIE